MALQSFLSYDLVSAMAETDRNGFGRRLELLCVKCDVTPYSLTHSLMHEMKLFNLNTKTETSE